MKGRDFTKECGDARLKGEIEIQRRSEGRILVIPVLEFTDHKSLQRRLARALGEKASRSLGVAKERGYVTMLAVDVERADTVGYLAEGVRMPDFASIICGCSSGMLAAIWEPPSTRTEVGRDGA